MEIEQEHPIPQQISSYSFRLVGDMTLKQFFQVAMGVVLGLLTYASPLPPIVKWPVVALFVLLGVGFAFFTIEDRPLETWIVIFFKKIIRPPQSFTLKQFIHRQSLSGKKQKKSLFIFRSQPKQSQL